MPEKQSKIVYRRVLSEIRFIIFNLSTITITQYFNAFKNISEFSEITIRPIT